MASPWLKKDADAAVSMLLASTTSGVVADVEIKNKPNKATPHPPHTDDLMRSPANADIIGVITTLVCVRKDARATALKRSPTVMRPFIY